MTQHAKVQSTAKCLPLRSLHLQFGPSHHRVYYLVPMSLHTVKATVARHVNVFIQASIYKLSGNGFYLKYTPGSAARRVAPGKDEKTT